ncbi:MAG: VOC family protein [Novosphingobium sp.]|nr:VOC family protein [Novosphingobium sp.]
MTVLFKRHFQVAYLVDDVHAAMAEFGEKYAIKKWHVMDMTQMHGEGSPTRFIALAWTDDNVMIELIEPDESVPSIYQNWRRDSGLSARFHHLGFIIESDEEYDAVKRQLAHAGCPVATEGSAGDMLQYAYIDTTREFGHFYELIYLKGEGKELFFAPVPRN